MDGDADAAALYDGLNPWGPSDDLVEMLAALERARRRAGVEWVEGRAADMAWEREFALAVMAGNVFQVFVTDKSWARRSPPPGRRWSTAAGAAAGSTTWARSASPTTS
jgi:hypothetical protein